MDRVVIALTFILGALLMIRFWPKSRFVRWSIMTLYFIAVLFLVLVSRHPGETAGLNLEPFSVLKRAVALNGATIFDGIRIRSRILIMDIVLNLLLFIPFGFILPCLSRKMAHWWAVIPLALCFSFFIEFTQYTAKLGTADVDDIINNTLGACIGWLLYLLFLKNIVWKTEKKKNTAKKRI